MTRSILTLIWNGKTERLRREFVAASRVRDEACKRLCAARLVGDTRTLHRLDAEYRAATHTALRAEIAWRAVRPRRPSIAAKRPQAVQGSAR